MYLRPWYARVTLAHKPVTSCEPSINLKRMPKHYLHLRVCTCKRNELIETSACVRSLAIIEVAGCNSVLEASAGVARVASQ